MIDLDADHRPLGLALLKALRLWRQAEAPLRRCAIESLGDDEELWRGFLTFAAELGRVARAALDPDRATIELELHGCARCAQSHGPLTFTELRRPSVTGQVSWTHWALCPVTGEPVMYGLDPAPRVFACRR